MEKKKLLWHPLYWIYHDNWQWHESKRHYSRYGDWTEHGPRHTHVGHIHFFMPTFPIQNKGNTQLQAYSGSQRYQFELEDKWSANANHEDAMNNIRVVGRPMWYVYISEYWRRIYIQDWDDFNNSSLSKDDQNHIVGKKGIKYDASFPHHTFGPFREGKDNFFFTTNLRRTLPVEYWQKEKNEQGNFTVRDHYLRKGDLVTKQGSWDFENDYPVRNDREFNDVTNDPWSLCYDNPNKPGTEADHWSIPMNYTNEQCYAYKSNSLPLYSKDDMSRRNYPDRDYINPTLEYQRVVHKNWERIDGWQERDREDPMGYGTNDFGDAWKIEIPIPYVKDQKIQSPFSNDAGIVQPAGTYCHEVVKEEDKLKYKADILNPNGSVITRQTWDEFEAIPNTFMYPIMENGGQNVQFETAGHKQDGKWVEQCLGAQVQVRCKVVVEDNMGGKTEKWVSEQQFNVNNGEFVGMDFGDPVE